jgi:hypothetical protein
VVAWAQWREWVRIDADHPPPAHDAVNARDKSVEVTARTVETTANPTREFVVIYAFATSITPRTLKPRPSLTVLGDQNRVPVHEKIGCIKGDAAADGHAQTAKHPSAIPDIAVDRIAGLKRSA